jgi:alcohol dehydrogenase YqhD (iron-dependent ADH family)
MRFSAGHRAQKFVQFAERIFALKSKGSDDIDCALQGIDRFEAFLKSIGCPTRLSELNIGDSLIARYAQDTLRIIHDENGKLPGRPAMAEADIIEVLKVAL